MSKREVEINGLTIAFNNAVEDLLKNNTVESYREIADKIGWTESGMSSARKEKINVPSKHIKTFENIYKIKIFNESEDQILSNLKQRVLRAEAHLEVYETALGQLLMTEKQDYLETVSLLRLRVQEALSRRLQQ